jgi:MFS family permease
MRETLQLFREEPRARVFFAVLAQSALGTGAGYVALLLVAFDRFESAWAISLVLTADLLPAMLLGPIFGAAADRWSRKACAIAADLIRVVAFTGVVLADGIEMTIAFAFLAGTGTALFTPATLAALPSLVRPARLPAATAVYGAIADFGLAVGPALAAGALALAGPEPILIANALTFAVSSAVLAGVHFGAAPARPASEGEGGVRRGLFRDAREGLRSTAGMPGLRVVLVASALALVFGGLVNVSELPFVTEELDASDVAFSLLVAVAGVGFIVGSLRGSRGGEPPALKRAYLAGLFVMAAGFLASGLAPVFGIALATFALAGFGNGMMLVYERLLIQAVVPDRLAARVFGIKDGLTAWAFAVAFIASGGIIELLDARTALLAAGVGGLLVAALAAAALRSKWLAKEAAPSSRRTIAAPLSDAGAYAVGHGRGGLGGAQLLDSRERWLALLDDLADGGDDPRVELGPGV